MLKKIQNVWYWCCVIQGKATVPAIIHVKLSGEGDFGPVDLECAIPPARLPVVMAALFGQVQPVPGMTGAAGAKGVAAGQDAGRNHIDHDHLRNPSNDPAGGGAFGGDAVGSPSVDPGMFITAFVGDFGDLVGRLHPRGFAEMILLAAVWLQYRDARSFVTRDDIRRLLRRQDHLRMPRNFSRDFHTAIERGYLDAVEEDSGYAVSSLGYRWFQMECRK